MWFIDIDGCVVKFNIQEYIGKISLFSNEVIRDMEYIIACVEYCLKCAKNNNESQLEIDFIENQVLRFVKKSLYERLRENRDCFLEYDNYENDIDREEYIKRYKELGVKNLSFDVPNIMKKLKECLRIAWIMIDTECQKARLERRKPKLPFSVIDDNNDIISESVDGMNVDQVIYERPVMIARSAFNRIVVEEENYANMRDNFLMVYTMIGNRRIVPYNKFYCPENLVLGVFETLQYIVDLGYYTTPLSHHTGERETAAKIQMFKEHIPFVPFFEA